MFGLRRCSMLNETVDSRKLSSTYTYEEFAGKLDLARHYILFIRSI